MMKKRNKTSAALIAVCCACVMFAASCAQSPQTGITNKRAEALAIVAVGLISAVIGGFALARSRGHNGNGRTSALAALAIGLIGMILSVVHLYNSTGIGTGGGRAGAIVALVLALIGVILGGLALARSRSTD